MITGAIVAVMAACTDLRTRQLVSIGTLFALRYRLDRRDRSRRTRPHLPRPFKVPLSPFVPRWPRNEPLLDVRPAIRHLETTNNLDGTGVVIYFFYGVKNSRLLAEE